MYKFEFVGLAENGAKEYKIIMSDTLVWWLYLDENSWGLWNKRHKYSAADNYPIAFKNHRAHEIPKKLLIQITALYELGI